MNRPVAQTMSGFTNPRIFTTSRDPGYARGASEAWVRGNTQRPMDVVADAFRARGGLIGGDDLAARLRPTHAQPISHIAQLIVSRRILTVDVQSHIMIPMFQIDVQTHTIRSAAARTMFELADVLDNSELGLWFSQPNEWLGNASPLEMLDIDPEGVVAAARADRFVSRG